MTVETKEVVTTISYLIGVRKDILELNFAECKDTLDKLYDDPNTTAGWAGSPNSRRYPLNISRSTV